MKFSLNKVEEMAPDQASLSAAKKLLKPAKWPVRGQNASVNTIWGQCQGSGANPYYTMADVVDHGYKCTCPSRKFPCKHVLALLWQYAEGADEFVAAEPPEWVNDWLGRRRKGAGGSTSTDTDKPKVKKNINAAGEQPEKQLSPEQLVKQAEAREKRAVQSRAATDASITQGIQELQQWLRDQLQAGFAVFIREVSARCRQIAARLVDAKAASLASRLDELPARVLEIPSTLQPHFVMRELGQLVLLGEAWLSNPDDVDVRRTIVTAESREVVLESSESQRIRGTWQTVGEKIYTRRDGLISHASWLLQVDSSEPVFALFQDYYPAGSGRREGGMALGRQLEGEMVYYPSRYPLRAILPQYQLVDEPRAISTSMTMEPLTTHMQHLSRLPWAEFSPCLLGRGRIVQDGRQGYWWQSGGQQLPLSNVELPGLLMGTPLQWAFVLWDGEQAELFSTHSQQWGLLSC